jgi:hypothetical protein
MEGFEKIVEESKSLLEFAKRELCSAERDKDEMRARQAAEKGYLALTKALNAFFLKRGKKEDELPKGERGRRHLLRSLGGRDMVKFYEALRASLHIDGFHEGIIFYTDIKEDIEEIESFITDLQNGRF